MYLLKFIFVNDNLNYKKKNDQNITEIYVDSLKNNTTKESKQITNILNKHFVNTSLNIHNQFVPKPKKNKNVYSKFSYFTRIYCFDSNNS